MMKTFSSGDQIKIRIQDGDTVLSCLKKKTREARVRGESNVVLFLPEAVGVLVQAQEGPAS